MFLIFNMGPVLLGLFLALIVNVWYVSLSYALSEYYARAHPLLLEGVDGLLLEH